MEILFSDKDILVAVKPRGVLSEDAGEGSLPFLLREAYGTLFPVHRLDRVVGGVMVYARNKAAAASLCCAVTDGGLTKEYHAVVEGVPEAPDGIFRDLLFKDARQNKSFVVKTPRKGAREASLAYRVLQTVTEGEKTYSLVVVKLHTGRSHQIRVQFASRGTPLVGDGKYGARTKAATPALFSTGLGFTHPKSGEPLSFAAPTPTEFPWSLFAAPQWEIERKFLIAYPDVEKIKAAEGCRRLVMTQTYLVAENGETRRVRVVREGAEECCYFTQKKRVTALRCVEDERQISSEEMHALLSEADPARHAIEKVRYAIPYAGHTLEVDVYPFWQDRAVLEVELASEGEAFLLPDFLKVIREVTDDKRYKNVNLAKSIPHDDI